MYGESLGYSLLAKTYAFSVSECFGVIFAAYDGAPR